MNVSTRVYKSVIPANYKTYHSCNINEINGNLRTLIFLFDTEEL